MFSRTPPVSPYAMALSRRIWNLRVALDRDEPVAAVLDAALAERNRHRCRDV